MLLVPSAPPDRTLGRMSDVTHLLGAAAAGDPKAAAELLPLVYDELRKLAAALGLPLRTAERNWTFARTWLYRELSQSPPDPEAQG